jgi:hypothetical protein
LDILTKDPRKEDSGVHESVMVSGGVGVGGGGSVEQELAARALVVGIPKFVQTAWQPARSR